MSSENQIIDRSYRTGLITKCGLLFAAGLLLTGVLLYFSAHQPMGPSYQASFARLANLKHEILVKSIIIYFIVITLTIGGVIFTTVLYSHRVVGPLVGLTRIIKAITSGDFTIAARLRKDDAIASMADTLNNMRDTCRVRLQIINHQVEELQVLLDNPNAASLSAEIAKKAQNIKQQLNQQQTPSQ